MRMRACLIAVVLSVASISPAMAEPMAYGVAYDELYRIDLATRQATYVGSAGSYAGIPLAALTGLTYGPGNDLYAFAAIRLAVGNLQKAVSDPQDLDARTRMLIAAGFAEIGDLAKVPKEA